MELQVKGGSAVTVEDAVFATEFKEALIHQVVVSYLAGGRQGSKAQKSRSDVSGGGRKPWKQKGTGRARAGTIRSPIWRSGGKTFAASPRNFAQKVNKKMYRSAMRSILAELVRQERLVVVESFEVEATTKSLVAKLGELEVNNTLIVTAETDEKLLKAARIREGRPVGFVRLGNKGYQIEVTEAANVNPVSLVGHETTVITVDALRKIEGWLA